MKKNNVFKVIIAVSILMAFIGIFLPETASRVLEVLAATMLLVTAIACWIVPSKEHTMVKIIITIVGYLAFLSWTLPISTIYNEEFVNYGLQRVSLYQLIEYPYIAIGVFLEPVLFILAVGGLYGILNSTGKYRNMLEKIAKSMKGKENVFLILTALILALLSSIFGLSLMLFIFIPALCGIIILMGYDKITAFITTFMAPLIGIIGSTYGTTVTGYINDFIGTTFQTELIAKIALFVISFIIFIAFLLKYANTAKEKQKSEVKEEIPFLGEKKESKKVSWPLFLILGILLVLLILGCTDWSGVFETEFFTDLHKTLTEWTIKDNTVIAYLITDLEQFGKWYYGEMTVMVLIASIILSFIYNIKLNDALSSFGKGVLKVLKPVALILFAYTVLVVTAKHPFIMTVTDWLFQTIQNVNGVFGKILYIIFSGISLILGSLLNIDLYYVLQSTTSYLTFTYATEVNSIAVMTQSFYGLTSFIAPTSVMMLLGLSYLGISYKEWLKNSWKLVLQLLAVIIIIILVVVFI